MLTLGERDSASGSTVPPCPTYPCWTTSLMVDSISPRVACRPRRRAGIIATVTGGALSVLYSEQYRIDALRLAVRVRCGRAVCTSYKLESLLVTLEVSCSPRRQTQASQSLWD